MHEIRNEDFVTALGEPLGDSNQVEAIFAGGINAVNDKYGGRGLWPTVNVDRNSVVYDGLSIHRTFPGIQRVGVAENLSEKKEDQEEPAEHEECYERKNSGDNFAPILMSCSRR